MRLLNYYFMTTTYSILIYFTIGFITSFTIGLIGLFLMNFKLKNENAEKLKNIEKNCDKTIENGKTVYRPKPTTPTSRYDESETREGICEYCLYNKALHKYDNIAKEFDSFCEACFEFRGAEKSILNLIWYNDLHYRNSEENYIEMYYDTDFIYSSEDEKSLITLEKERTQDVIFQYIKNPNPVIYSKKEFNKQKGKIIKAKGMLKRGRLEGMWHYYNEDGSIKYQGFFQSEKTKYGSHSYY